MRAFSSASAVLYNRFLRQDRVAEDFDFTAADISLMENVGSNVIVGALGIFNELASFLWVLADNCSYAEEGFLEMYVQEGANLYLSASLTPTMEMANGKTKLVEFTVKDLEQAVRLRDSWSSILAKSGSANSRVGNDPEQKANFLMKKPERLPTSASERSSTRLSRFFYFLQSARTVTDLGVKISLYCTCLEALLSTGSSELSHKVAERTACFIESDTAAKVECYKFIKRAYNVRSKVTHGDTLSALDAKELCEIAPRLDFYLRRVFGKLLSEKGAVDAFLGGQMELEEYFLHLVLG